jgi:hypothetical protein
MATIYEAPQAQLVGEFRADTAFTSRGEWIDVLGWWF